jgi:hypothetical protein
MALYHVSEEPDIARFEPRPSMVFPSLGSVVWAIDEPHLVNYLLPRDCPRVTFCAVAGTGEADRRRFSLTGSARVVVISRDWVDRVRATPLYVYELPPLSFGLHDESAGYWVSRDTVAPLHVRLVPDAQGEILRRGADLRVVDRLKDLQDEIVASTVDFSIIRMRNAVL